MSTYQTGVMWPIAGSIVKLAIPVGYALNSRTVPLAISDDGSVIVGSVVDAVTNLAAACRWDTDGTVCTELLAISGIERAVACSSDASVIYGSDFANTTVCRWTSDGTSGALMVPQGADTSAQFTDLPLAICSSNGSIVVGLSQPSSTPTIWTNGTEAALSGGANNVGGCSDAGSVVSGSVSGQPPVYWNSGTQRTLDSIAFDSYSVYGVNGAGTVIHGRDNNTGTNVWWDGLGSNVGPVYGTLHTSGNSPPLSTAFVNSKTNNVVVGTVDDSGVTKAAKWAVGIETALPLLGDWDSSSGVCVSGDGTVKGGQANLTTNPVAAYWDASDTAFMLPENVTGLEPTARNSIMTGVSRDGSVFFGQAIYVEAVPPPPAPTPDNLVRGSLRRTQLPQPPKPSQDFMKFQRDMIAWAWTVKARLETDSTVNTRPVGPLVVSTFTLVSTVTGTDDLSNFVATFVSLLQGHGYTVPFDLRTNT